MPAALPSVISGMYNMHHINWLYGKMKRDKLVMYIDSCRTLWHIDDLTKIIEEEKRKKLQN